MTAALIKTFLDSFCEENERDFSVVLSKRSPRQLKGKYVIRKKLIVLYPKSSENPFELEQTALHELAHHLCWKRNEAQLLALRHQGKRLPRHGREFKDIYYDLLAALDWRHEETSEPFPSRQTPEEKLFFAIFRNSSSPCETVIGRKAK